MSLARQVISISATVTDIAFLKYRATGAFTGLCRDRTSACCAHPSTMKRFFSSRSDNREADPDPAPAGGISRRSFLRGLGTSAATAATLGATNMAKGLAEAGEGCLATIEMPKVHPLIAPLVYAVPVQLLAYHTACVKGTDVDQPRNLAKSLTVE